MTETEETDDLTDDLLHMTTDIVAAYLGNNNLPTAQISEIIKGVHRALETAAGGNAVVNGNSRPAVPIKKSITPDYMICLEDGKKLKMLKRYLRSTHGLSPDQYRAKWGLSADYPMVAPNYAKQRSAFAKKIGLGRSGRMAKK